MAVTEGKGQPMAVTEGKEQSWFPQERGIRSLLLFGQRRVHILLCRGPERAPPWSVKSLCSVEHHGLPVGCRSHRAQTSVHG